LLALPLLLAFGVVMMMAENGTHGHKPKRINRAVELLAGGQPIYYTGFHTGAPGGGGDSAAAFEQGKKDAQTYADYISYDMEHTAYDIVGLTAYMNGLVAGGPTRSGHRTLTVIVNVPVNGLDEAIVRANSWMFQQVLGADVHGIMLTHADNPGAIKAFVEGVRVPSHKQGIGQLLGEGHRVVHAAAIWGISVKEYEEKAASRPLTPDGSYCWA
jgi:4-hydroxy-2-oxoheptanedioate aldolase